MTRSASAQATGFRVLGICGSLQRASSNLSALQVAASAPPTGVAIHVFDGVRALPHFDPDLAEAGPPESVVRFRDALAQSDAVLITCPEYGHSLPGALKNAIDWVIGSGELYQKVVGVTAIVAFAERGRRGLGALCQTLRAVDARVVGGTPIVRGPTCERDLRDLVEALVATHAQPVRP
jgi:chromate reductase, NAD(P)H dehydrogenase (quinone)